MDEKMEKEKHERLLGRWPRKCEICEKDFFANDDWVYKVTEGKKRKIRWFCSWHCKQEYIQKKEGKKHDRAVAADNGHGNGA